MKTKKPRSKKGKSASPKGRESWISGVKDKDLKAALRERAKKNPGVAPGVAGGRKKKRSDGIIFMKPVCQVGPCGNPNQNPKDPCSGFNFVSQPDVAIQLVAMGGCPSDADKAQIKTGIITALTSALLPDPDVRINCDQVSGVVSIHIWGTQPNGSCEDLARRRAQVPDLLGGSNNPGAFGLYLNSSVFFLAAYNFFQSTPKSIDEAGNPTLNGPVYVQGLTIAFIAPATIRTIVSAVDTTTWPHTLITLTIDDELKLDRESSTTTHFTVDPRDTLIASGFGVLATLGLGFLLSPFLFLIAGGLLIYGLNVAVDASGASGPNVNGGIGALVFDTLPRQISLPERSSGLATGTNTIAPALARGLANTIIREKIIVNYGRTAVDNTGVYVTGFIGAPVTRTPSVTILGPAELVITSDATSTFGDYAASVNEFYGRLIFDWSDAAESRDQQVTRFHFPRGSAKVGQSFTQTISVTVFDQEGSMVKTSLVVTIAVVDFKSVPPICQSKGWLPQCKPA